MQAGRAEICLLNLMGEVVAGPQRAAVRGFRTLIPAAAKLLAGAKSAETFSIGLATPGLLDLEKQEVMMGILDPGLPYRSIRPLLEAAGKIPLVVENDVHAMSAKWLLSQTKVEPETVLMVFIADGQIGSALLVDGHPTPGCVVGSHELGHSRFPVKTRRCYCGQLGCLERIFSSNYLRDTAKERRPLGTALSRFPEFESKLGPLISLLGCGIANMMNFLRPHRLVLVGEILSHPMAREAVTRSIREQTLKALAGRIQMQFWEQPALRSAEMAGWLALAAVYRPGWLS
jgi:predicted NBD/HSP70 family sugar kinase